MTTTEPEIAVEANGAAAAPTEEAVEGVEYLKNGTARFTIGGRVYTLHPPTIGQLKRLHGDWMALANRPAVEQLEGQLRWVKLCFNGDDAMAGLSDRRLDDNADEWPAWIGVAAYQFDLMTHFLDVPLARGGPVKAKQ